MKLCKLICLRKVVFLLITKMCYNEVFKKWFMFGDTAEFAEQGCLCDCLRQHHGLPQSTTFSLGKAHCFGLDSRTFTAHISLAFVLKLVVAFTVHAGNFLHYEASIPLTGGGKQ